MEYSALIHFDVFSDLGIEAYMRYNNMMSIEQSRVAVGSQEPFASSVVDVGLFAVYKVLYLDFCSCSRKVNWV